MLPRINVSTLIEASPCVRRDLSSSQAFCHFSLTFLFLSPTRARKVTREAQLIEQEKMQINALLAEGKTRHEIASMGLYSALDPNVMGREA